MTLFILLCCIQLFNNSSYPRQKVNTTFHKLLPHAYSCEFSFRNKLSMLRQAKGLLPGGNSCGQAQTLRPSLKIQLAIT